LALVLVLSATTFGKTITLTDEKADLAASIAAEGPRVSWMGYQPATGQFNTAQLDLFNTGGVLIRFPLDAIPKGQRIVKAELMIPVAYFAGYEPRLHVWRVLAEWGVGVSWQYRMQRPEKVEWKMAGARAPASDRAAKPTAIVRVTAMVEQVANVTEDVELWYKGAAPNRGWLFTIEDEGPWLRLGSPGWSPGQWKLRITYEPE
jgi:hypothetical protein